MHRNNLLLCSLLILQLIPHSEQKICPILQVSHRNKKCSEYHTSQTIEVNSDSSGSNTLCQIIEDGLYKISCSENGDEVILSPCFSSNTFLGTKVRTIGECYSNEGAGRGSEVKSYKFFGSEISLNGIGKNKGSKFDLFIKNNLSGKVVSP